MALHDACVSYQCVYVSVGGNIAFTLGFASARHQGQDTVQNKLLHPKSVKVLECKVGG